jgi:hypothetical protein
MNTPQPDPKVTELVEATGFYMSQFGQEEIESNHLKGLPE